MNTIKTLSEAVSIATVEPLPDIEPLQEFVKSVGDGKYSVFSHKGKRLSKPASRKKALERLRQIEYFKHQGA